MMKKPLNSITGSLFCVILLLSGCFNDSRNDDLPKELSSELKIVQEQLLTVNEELKLAKAEISSLKSSNMELTKQLVEERNRNASVDSYIKTLSEEYQNFYFDICSEVGEQNTRCAPELKYFDPRELKIGDRLFGMTISSISIGEHDPGSYIISFEGVVEVSGRYFRMKDEYIGEHIEFITNTINEQDYEVSFVLGSEYGSGEFVNQFNATEGIAVITINKMILMRLPHKPGYNHAIFESLVEEGNDIS